MPAQTPEFSDEETRLLQDVTRAVWNEIAYDIISALQEQGEEPRLPQDEVLELVLDADRPEPHIRYATKRWEPARRAEFLARWEAASYEQKQALILPAFPFDWYGL